MSATRIRMLASALMVLSIMLLGPSIVVKPAATAAPYDLPLIDAHDHLQRRASAEDLIKLMDLTGVSRMVLMALTWDPEKGSDRQALEYARRYPGRFLPFIAFQTPESGFPPHWVNLDRWAQDRLSDVEGKLKGGGFLGMGEILVRHYTYSIPEWGITAANGEVDIPGDSPLMFRIADLAAKYRVPMIIHAEGEPLVIATTSRMIGAHPDARVIWAHDCGRQSATEIRRLLNAHPNLYCDLAGMTGSVWNTVAGWGPRQNRPWTFPIADSSDTLAPDMKDLFEALPDRFLVGMDSPHYGLWQYYVPKVVGFRRILSQLPQATADKLAHENAERLFGLPAVAKP